MDGAAVCLLLLILPAVVSAAPAEIDYVEGQVTVERASMALDATIGMALKTGDAVVTGSNGVAIIALSPQTTLKTRENTRIVLDSLGPKTSVGLTKGGLFSRIIGHLAGSYDVTTPTATAGVRGTEFFIAFGRTIEKRPDVWLCVNRGTVNVSVAQTGRSVAVPAGKGIDILAGTKITHPRAYAWTKQLNWNMDPASAPVRDRTNLDQAYSDLLNQDYD